VNREAELERPSRVACSDLLGGVFLMAILLPYCKKAKEPSKCDGARYGKKEIVVSPIRRCAKPHEIDNDGDQLKNDGGGNRRENSYLPSRPV
jgi:hypothetical protein